MDGHNDTLPKDEIDGSQELIAKNVRKRANLDYLLWRSGSRDSLVANVSVNASRRNTFMVTVSSGAIVAVMANSSSDLTLKQRLDCSPPSRGSAILASAPSSQT